MTTYIAPSFMHVIQPVAPVGSTGSASFTFGVFIPGPGADPQAALDAIFSINKASWQPTLATTAEMRPAVGYYNDGGPGLVQLTAAGATAVGGDAAGTVPSNGALIVKKRTNRVGRRFRGRCYIPWVVNEADASNNGVLTAGAVTAFQTRATTWFNNLQAAPSFADMYILPAIVPEGETQPGPVPVTNVVIATTIGTQRRRLGLT